MNPAPLVFNLDAIDAVITWLCTATVAVIVLVAAVIVVQWFRGLFQ
jgi:hypothetical protein